MPIININTPNLVADIAQIDAFIVTILAGAPTTVDTFFVPCWTLKPSGDCDTLILTDFTDYDGISAIDLDNVTISATFGPVGDCCEIVTTPCSVGLIILPNAITSYTDLNQDGLYCAEITITYYDPISELTYTKVMKVAYTSDCCEAKYRDLSYNIWGKMSDIACSITKLTKVGRNIKTLKESYLQLSNLLWLYYNSCDPCIERDKVFCIFNKIK